MLLLLEDAIQEHSRSSSGSNLQTLLWDVIERGNGIKGFKPLKEESHVPKFLFFFRYIRLRTILSLSSMEPASDFEQDIFGIPLY